MEKGFRDLKVFVKNVRLNVEGKFEDYTGLYKVSDNGVIMDSDWNEVPQSESKRYPPYMSVFLTDRNGKTRERLVHRIVASTFTDICGDFDEVVNHLDENKHNNSAYNLSWTTNKANLSWGTSRKRAAESRRINRFRVVEKPKINYSELLVNF